MPNCGETETSFHKNPFRYGHPEGSSRTCENCWYWKDTDKTKGINGKAVCITEGTCPYRKPRRREPQRYTMTSGDGSGGKIVTKQQVEEKNGRYYCPCGGRLYSLVGHSSIYPRRPEVGTLITWTCGRCNWHYDIPYAKGKKQDPDREKVAEEIMNGLGKMLGMPSVPKWNSLADYLKEPYLVFADQILALIGDVRKQDLIKEVICEGCGRVESLCNCEGKC